MIQQVIDCPGLHSMIALATSNLSSRDPGDANPIKPLYNSVIKHSHDNLLFCGEHETPYELSDSYLNLGDGKCE